ncbi:MAG: hypothetical protein KF754_16300 [Planctomycetes bacterium]|nr:hypothetical protein [Planctomycetota bacterium]
MIGRPAELDDEIQHERSQAALSVELAELNLRLFAREAVIACMVLCAIGTLGLLVCMLGNFNVGFATSGHTQIVGMEGQYGAYRPERNITPLVMAGAAAAFASSLIVAGGALPQYRRMPGQSGVLIACTGLASLAGLLVLVLSMTV